MISDASQDQEWDPAVLRDTVQWENVLGRIRMRALLGVSRGTELRPIDQLRRAAEPRPIIQLLYATRYCEHVERRDRFYSLGALMPHDAPTGPSAQVSSYAYPLYPSPILRQDACSILTFHVHHREDGQI